MAGRDHGQDHSRSDARRKRPPVQEDAPPPIFPVFDAPVRANTNDDLSLIAQKSLGSYDYFKGLKPHELGNLHGIQYQPQTPLPGEGKNISHFPVINGQVRVSRTDQGQSSSSRSSSGQARNSPADVALQKRPHPPKPAPAGASSSKGVKRESGLVPPTGSSASTTSSSSSSSATSKPHRSSSHDRNKDSAPRRSKDSSSVGRTKPPSSGGGGDASHAQSRTSSSSQSSKSDRPQSLPTSSKSGSSRPASNSASRGGGATSNSDSKTVLHANGLVTQTYSSHSISGHQAKSSSNTKSEAKESKTGSHDKKDSSSSRSVELPFVSPMPEMVKGISSHPPSASSSREGKKERDSDSSKPRPKLDIPKKGPPGHSKHKEVEKIFEKMTLMKPPVSAIQTPIKAEVPKFSFNEATHPNKSGSSQSSVPRKKLVDAISDDAHTQSQKKSSQSSKKTSSSLHADLVLSEESEDEETQETDNARLNSSNQAGEENNTSSLSHRQSAAMKRGSDSDSSGSESDAEENTSDEGSESESEAETPPPSPPPPSPPKKKSYNLMSQIRKLQGEIPQMAPSTPSLQRGPPSVENPLSNSRLEAREGSKHMDQSAESGDNNDDEHDSFSKYNHDNSRVITDFNQLIGPPKASPSGSKSKSSGKSVSKPSASSKPTVKHAQPRTDNSSSSKSSSSKGSAAPKVKSETNSKENAKLKPSKQSGKQPSSQSKKSAGTGSAKSSAKSQEKKPTQRAKPGEKKKQPKSRVTVDTTDESDVEEVRTPSRPHKAANTSTSSSSSSASSSSSSSSGSSNVGASDPRVSKVKLQSGKRMPGTKKGDSTPTVKHEPIEAFEQHRTHIDDMDFSMSPIVSPIRPDMHEDDRSPFVERLPEVHYDAEGKPSLFVRLRRELINHLPGVYSYGSNVPSTSTQRRKDSTDPLEKKPSAIVKPVKRKQTEFEKEKPGRPEPKRSRLENKSPRRMREEALRDDPPATLEPFASAESSLDGRPSSERRGSVSSMTGQSSGRGRKSDRDHQSSRSKRDPSGGRDHGSQSLHSWTSPERRPDRQYTADDYLAEGKRLKHQADTQVDKHTKALMYFEAMLYMTSCGNAFEMDRNYPVAKAVTMYSDTCEIIRYILKLKGIQSGQEGNSNDSKLAILCYRSQALLNMQMYKLKHRSALKLSRLLSEHLKGATSSKPQPPPPPQQNPAPWSSSARYTGTPSPVSPTPSPAGSVGSACSMGSQGSTSSDLVPPSQPSGPPPQPSSAAGGKMCNGVNPQSSVTLRIMSTFLTYSNYSLHGIDYWEQADMLMQDNRDFFMELDAECGKLTLHSSTQELVTYVGRGLFKLKNL